MRQMQFSTKPHLFHLARNVDNLPETRERATEQILRDAEAVHVDSVSRAVVFVLVAQPPLLAVPFRDERFVEVLYLLGGRFLRKKSRRLFFGSLVSWLDVLTAGSGFISSPPVSKPLLGPCVAEKGWYPARASKLVSFRSMPAMRGQRLLISKMRKQMTGSLHN